MTEFELDPYVERIAREARRPVAVDPGARERLLAAVRAEPAPRRTGGMSSVRIVRPITMTTPRFAALAAGLIAIGVLLGAKFGRGSQATGHPQEVAVNPSQPPASGDTGFTFVVVAPTAKAVSVVGDFNQWDTSATRMQRIGNSGAWTVSVPMSTGRHLYSFVTVGKDGEHWIADPHAPAAPDDGFGRASSVVIVGKGTIL